MATKTRNNVIDKIQALLRKTPDRGASEAEAQSAVEMAQKLLLKHNLSMKEVEQIGDEVEDPVTKGVWRSENSPKISSWHSALAHKVGKAMFVEVIISNRNSLHFIGRPDNVATAMETFVWIAHQVWRIAHAERGRVGSGARARFETGFRIGLIYRIGQRLEETFRVEEELDSNVTALVIQYGEENQKFIDDTYGKLRTSRSRSVDFAGYHAGRSAGDQVSLFSGRSQVTGGK